MRSVNRILKINEIDGYKISCLFNNGESRIIDFELLFKNWKIKKGHIAYPLVEKIEEFQKVEIVDGTLTWKNITISSKDEAGNDIVQYFDLDPAVLFENSALDESRNIVIGLMIRQTRIELGMTQEELANKAGTTKHYISRIENSKSDIELMTLKKIVEGGFGKRLKIKIA